MEAVAAARAEAAWLRGDREGVVQATEATLRQASALGARRPHARRGGRVDTRGEAGAAARRLGLAPDGD